MIPALHDVGHRVHSTSGVDDHGNAVDSWAAVVAKKFVTWADYSTSEPSTAGHVRDEVDCGIIVYPDFGSVSPRDRMVIDGQEFEVVGQPSRNDKAPWMCDIENWVIHLKVVNG